MRGKKEAYVRNKHPNLNLLPFLMIKVTDMEIVESDQGFNYDA